MTSLAARPTVDGIEREFGETAHFVRLSQHTPVGRAFADRLDLHVVPSLVAYDETGVEQLRCTGRIPSPEEVATALQQE